MHNRVYVVEWFYGEYRSWARFAQPRLLLSHPSGAFLQISDRTCWSGSVRIYGAKKRCRDGHGILVLDDINEGLSNSEFCGDARAVGEGCHCNIDAGVDGCSIDLLVGLCNNSACHCHEGDIGCLCAFNCDNAVAHHD